MEHFDTKIGKFHKVVVKFWAVGGSRDGVGRLSFSSRFQIRPKRNLPHQPPGSRIFSSDIHFVIAKRPFAQMPAKKPKKPTATQKRKLAKEAETSDTTSKRPRNDSAPETSSRPPKTRLSQ
jgi:hypothetical protein